MNYTVILFFDSINLTLPRLTISCNQSKAHLHIFDIIVRKPGKKSKETIYSLRADNEQEMIEWVACLKKVHDSYIPEGAPDPLYSLDLEGKVEIEMNKEKVKVEIEMDKEKVSESDITPRQSVHKQPRKYMGTMGTASFSNKGIRASTPLPKPIQKDDEIDIVDQTYTSPTLFC